MLRITAMKSEKYFKDGLKKADYYRDKILQDPVWQGKLAKILGIEGQTVTAENFTQLFNNINPATGQQVTPVMAKDRKPYYDFTFSAPKSVSVLWATTENVALHDAISKAFDESVREAMEFAEKKLTLARDKRNGGVEYNKTENLVYAFFNHDTGRPVKGKADPHLHTHGTVFNMTYDGKIGKMKAVEFHDLAKYRNLIEAYHHSSLAKKLQELGIVVENTLNSFEVNGFSRDLIDKFSNRTKIIEEYIEKAGITSEKSKGEAGKKTREKKQNQELSREESKAEWISRFSSSEIEMLRGIETFFSKGQVVDMGSSEDSTRASVEQSINHFLERDTVVDINSVITYAMNSNLKSVTYDSVLKELDKKELRKEIIRSKDYKPLSGVTKLRGGKVEYLTTTNLLNQEDEILKYISNSTNNYKPINQKNNLTLSSSMSVDQDRVFYQVLNSSNSIDIIKGNPGSGKTYLLQNLKTAIESSGKTVHAYAPTSIAGRKVLREEVTPEANTIQSLFINTKEQEKLNSNSVVFIDEAGLLSYSDMLKLLELQTDKNFKLELVGDTKQNSPVMSGDALKLIEIKSELKTFKLEEIRRQNANPLYKRAIEQLTSNQIKEGFDTLDNAGYVKEIKSKVERNKLLSKKYVEFVIQDMLLSDKELKNENKPTKSENDKNIENKAKSKVLNEKLIDYSTNNVLALSASNMEVKELNKNIRREMINNKLVGKENIEVTTLVDRKLTIAEKQNPLMYSNGDVLVATQNTKDLKIGKEYKVVFDDKGKSGTEKPKITIYKVDEKNPKKRIKEIIDIPYKDAKSFNVNLHEKLKLSKGDTITLTLNGNSTTGTRLLKESRHKVKDIELDKTNNKPKITLDNNQVLKQDFKYLNYGYATTNYKSQGLTVKHVLISQSETSQIASGKQSLLVASSRAKQSILLLTDDKKALKKSFHLDRSKGIGRDLQEPNKIKRGNNPRMGIGI